MKDMFGNTINNGDYIFEGSYLKLFYNNKYIAFRDDDNFYETVLYDCSESVVIGNLSDIGLQLLGNGKNVIKLFHDKITPGSLIIYILSYYNETEPLIGMYVGKNKVLTSTGRVSTLKEESVYFPIFCKNQFYSEKEKLFNELYQSLAIKSGNKAIKTMIGSCINTKTGVYVYIGEYTLNLHTNVCVQLKEDFIGKKKYYVRVAENVEDLLLMLNSTDKLYTSELKKIIEEGSIKLGECYTSATALSNLIHLGEQTEGVGGYGTTIDTLSFGTLEAFKKVSTLSKSFNIIDDINFNVVTFYSGLVTVNFV